MRYAQQTRAKNAKAGAKKGEYVMARNRMGEVDYPGYVKILIREDKKPRKKYREVHRVWVKILKGTPSKGKGVVDHDIDLMVNGTRLVLGDVVEYEPGKKDAKGWVVFKRKIRRRNQKPVLLKAVVAQLKDHMQFNPGK